MTWLIAIPLLGLVTGMRSMTAMAVLCWFAYLGHLPVDETWAFWTAKLMTAVIFTVLAAAELIADKLPATPDRIALGPLMARLCLAVLVGAVVAAGLDGPGVEGVILSVLGMLVGAYGGFLARRDLVQRLRWKDWHVAVVEDAIAVACAVLAMGVVTG